MRRKPRFDDEAYEETPAAESPLDPFLTDGLISDVLYTVKSGKEATVYCCRAGQDTGVEFLAAKVYRPIESRGFRNDAVYQAGRVILEKRAGRAYAGKTAFGREVQYGLWVAAEWETLRLLHRAGADVPRPVAQASGAILMEYVGDASGPAPVLHNVALSEEEARPLFEATLRNIELWLACNRVHADLSPYNILYRDGRLTTIDFPQAVDPRFNANARDLLTRDMENICRYWARHGVEADPQRIVGNLWRRFMRQELAPISGRLLHRRYAP